MINLAIVICLKNEGPYLREWIEFHRLVGFRYFYFYDNESDDETAEICREYVDRRMGKYKYLPGSTVQRAAYVDGLKQARTDHVDWCAFIDCDEFLFSPKHIPLPEVLIDYEKYPGIGAHWLLFGSSGLEEYDSRPVIERFTGRQDDINWHIKSIVKPSRTLSPADVHCFLYSHGLAVNEKKEIIPPHTPLLKNGSVDILRINHYVIKSRAESHLRVMRGRADSSIPHRWPEHFDAHDRNEVKDVSIQYYLPALKDRLNELAYQSQAF